jgi:hypothetical protein
MPRRNLNDHSSYFKVVAAGASCVTVTVQSESHILGDFHLRIPGDSEAIMAIPYTGLFIAAS